MSVNDVLCGGHGGRGPMRGRGDGGSRGDGHNGHSKISFQVCGKTGQSALRCYKSFDANYHGEEKAVNAASTGYNVDT
jgi:hypothetical protein